jgi:hypothetical protein
MPKLLYHNFFYGILLRPKVGLHVIHKVCSATPTTNAASSYAGLLQDRDTYTTLASMKPIRSWYFKSVNCGVLGGNEYPLGSRVVCYIDVGEAPMVAVHMCRWSTTLYRVVHITLFNTLP